MMEKERPLKLFEPPPATYKTDDRANTGSVFGERGRGQVYVWDDKTVFAVQVAQATRRPLLLRGPAGSGKSSLAPFVANVLGEPFYAFTANARSQARDMMWEFDALGRLNDANVSSIDADAKARVAELHSYLEPGKLWWAFDRDSAKRRATPSEEKLSVPLAVDPAGSATGGESAVVLIDEIDKADPDVPNNLLEALGSRRFTVQETGDVIRDLQQPLVVITTNEERELPHAFLRRCVVLHLRAKTPTELCTIAEQHFGARDDQLFREVAGMLTELQSEAAKQGGRPPSTAEYLDAVDACIKLGVTVPEWGPGDESRTRWEQLLEVALGKSETLDFAQLKATSGALVATAAD